MSKLLFEKVVNDNQFLTAGDLSLKHHPKSHYHQKKENSYPLINDIRSAYFSGDAIDTIKVKRKLAEQNEKYSCYNLPTYKSIQLITPCAFDPNSYQEKFHVIFISGNTFNAQFYKTRDFAISSIPNLLITITDNQVSSEKMSMNTTFNNEIRINLADQYSIENIIKVIDHVFRTVQMPGGLICFDFADLKEFCGNTAYDYQMIEGNWNTAKEFIYQLSLQCEDKLKNSKKVLVLLSLKPKGIALRVIGEIQDAIELIITSNVLLSIADSDGRHMRSKMRSVILYT